VNARPATIRMCISAKYQSLTMSMFAVGRCGAGANARV
jgi:hypothetical protein